ncbi:MAG: glycosyltransferase, partial [Candidatus Omnitrophica bacterium]|nr:glycosyltransferase [Candidatus Omnitrophota bacterium]
IRDTQYAKRNILYIIWSLGLGGAERVVINLAKGLDKNKYNVTVCCLNDKGQFAYELEKEGIEVVALNKKGAFDISIVPRLSSLIRRYNIDIVHTHLWGANFWGRIAAKLANVKVIIATEHNMDTWKNGGYFILDRWVSSFTDKVIVVSESVKDFYYKKIGLTDEKSRMIHNGIESEKYALAKKGTDFKTNGNEIVIGIVGRLVPQKGHKYFLLAMKELVSKHRIKGLIVGSGPMGEELKQYSKDLGLNGNVVFTGLRQDIPEVLKSLDILVLPSLREGLPIVALEAMASGVPVVATNVGGTPEVVIDNETGILIEPENERDIVNAIGRLIEDKVAMERLICNARRHIQKNFTIEKMVLQHESLYTELLSE